MSRPGKVEQVQILKLEDRFKGDLLLTHFEQYAEKYLRIRDKNGALIPFKLNTTQRVILERIREQRRRGLPPRIIVLKSRQVGVSTLAEALGFYDCHANDGRSALVLAHTEKSSRLLFQMTRRFQREMPKEYRWKPRLDNVREIAFDLNDSKLQVETAGEVRAYTAQTVHLSEFAFVELAAETLRSILQTVPRSPNTLVIIESTANGAGNAYHSLWVNSIVRAADKRLHEWERGWIPVFVPWFEHHEYQMRPWFLPDDTSNEERLLARRHRLNMRQIAWRRWCIDANCGGELDTFNQEYPSTWRDAFLLSGRPVFSSDAIRFYQSLVPPEVPEETLPPRMEIELEEGTMKPVLSESRTGRLRIYAAPIPRHTYVVGVDPSEGDAKSDPSPCVVMDQMNLDCVAVWHGRTPPEELAGVAMALGWYYNEALIINEANNHGIAFHNEVIRRSYPNLFYRKVDEQSVAGEIGKKPGWLQTNRLKHTAINLFRRYAREKANALRNEPGRMIRDPKLVEEMSALIYKDSASGAEGSRIVAQPGHHKDLVIAFALCLAAHAGDSENPLEALPEEQLMSAAYEVMLRRERDPEGAERQAIDVTGMTCEELERLSEARWRTRMRRNATEAMR